MSAQAYGSAFQALSYTETESKKRLCNAMFNASVELDGAGYSSGREKKKKKDPELTCLSTDLFYKIHPAHIKIARSLWLG